MNQSEVEVLNSTVTLNESIKGGGGISCEYSDVTINDSLIDGNTCTGATCNGGGIRVLGTGLHGQGVALTDSTITDNIAEGNGGGVALMVQTGTSFSSVRSTLAFNNASLNGGGLYSLSQHNVIASTISGNVAGQIGGGIYHQGGGELHVFESTIARNHAATTGGLYVHSASNPLMFGDIIALNTANAGNRDLLARRLGRKGYAVTAGSGGGFMQLTSPGSYAIFSGDECRPNTVYGSAVFDLDAAGVNKAARLRFVDDLIWDSRGGSCANQYLDSTDTYLLDVQMLGYSGACPTRGNCPTPAGFMPVQ